jgi:hypothetical protein
MKHEGAKRLSSRLSTEQVETFLRRARTAFLNSGFVVGSLKHTSPDFWDLGLVGSEDQTAAVRSVLDEISAPCYCGPHPPKHISQEPKCRGAVMVQFVWNSACFQRKMYVKFCMVGDRLAVLRIHNDYKRPNEKS